MPKAFEFLVDKDVPAGDVIVPALGHKLVRPGDVVDFPDEYVDALLEQPQTWKPSGWTPPEVPEPAAAELTLAEGQPPPPLGVAAPVAPAADAYVIPAGDDPATPALDLKKKDTEAKTPPTS